MDSSYKPTPFENALDKFNNLVASKRGKSLSKAEVTVIRGIWQEKSYTEIADSSDYTVNYLQRTLAPKMFKELTRSLGEGEINKNTLRILFERLTVHEEISLEHLNKIRGDILPDISEFYGRSAEISHLESEISSNHNRCITILGVAGIGKSTLAAKLLADLSLREKRKIDCFIWKSVVFSSTIKRFSRRANISS